MRTKLVLGAILAFIVFSAIVFTLYQQQEALRGEQEYEPDLGELPFVEESDITPVAQGSVLSECGSQENQYDKDFCWFFEAYEEMAPDKCLNVEERPRRIDCLRAIARDFESEETQQALDDCNATHTDFEGYYDCVEGLVPKMKNEKLSICNAYFSDDETQKYRCHAEVARELMDYSICEDIPESTQNYYRKNCFWIVDLENPLVDNSTLEWPYG